MAAGVDQAGAWLTGTTMPADKKPPARDAGPAGAFAYAMFELWEAAGKPTLRSMGEQVNMHHSSLSRVMKDDRVSSWESVRAFGIACGADPEVMQPRWQRAKDGEKAVKAAAKLSAAGPSGPPRGQARPRRDSTPSETRSSTAAQAGRRPPARAKATSPPADRSGAASDNGPPLPVVPEVGAGVRELPPLPLPLREGVAERLTTTVLEHALHASRRGDKPLLDVLARMLECDVDTAAECLVHSVLAVRARNERLQQRLAWATPPSPYFPTHLLPTPQVQLVPTGDPATGGQLIVVGRSARQPGAHRADDEDTVDDPAEPTPTPSSGPWRLTPVPPPTPTTAATPAAGTASPPRRRHGLDGAAKVRPLPPPAPPPPRRDTPDPTTAQPAHALAEATGTDTLRPLTPVPPPPPRPQYPPPRPAALPANSQQHSSSTARTARESSTEERSSTVGTRPEAEANPAHRTRSHPHIGYRVGLQILTLWLIAPMVCVYLLLTPHTAAVPAQTTGAVRQHER
jgi:hypothetical protein